MEITPWTPQDGTRTACEALDQVLTGTLQGTVRREVSGVPAGGVARAWGDPAVVLRCGVPQPAEYRPDSQLAVVDGVDWLPVQGDGGYFFVTVGRVAYVEVAVPSTYAPEAGVLTALGGPIRRTIPPAG